MLSNKDKNNQNLNDSIKEIVDYTKGTVVPAASVIIVAYNPNIKLFKQCLTSLQEQTIKDFEVVVVDNSDKSDLHSIVSLYECKYLKLTKNFGPSVARNIGIMHAQGDIVIFLDDDAIPARNFVEEHIQAYQNYDIVGLRGKSLPRTNSVYNYLAHHYDLGDKPHPFYIDLEGNCSFKKDLLIIVGCFNYSLLPYGVEGLELSYRIVSYLKDKNKLLYNPNAIIYHDFSNSFLEYVKKRLRHAEYREILKEDYPDIVKFTNEYSLISKNAQLKNLGVFSRIQLFFIVHIEAFIRWACKNFGI